MSLAVGAGGEVLVVDQVNGRLARFGPDGAPRASTPIGLGAQDVAVGADGTTAVLDRLVDRNVTILGPDGRTIGTLPLAGKGVRDTGGVTGVFVDGSDVYVEREHGHLVRVGGTDGDSGGARAEIPGRPSRDGSSYVSARIDVGAAYLTAITRATRQHRYTRALPVAPPVRSLLLLDTDRRGTVYVATLTVAADGTESEQVTCSALADGTPLGEAQVPPNTMPEETFREFAVLDDGGVLHAEMSDEGMEYVRYDCR